MDFLIEFWTKNIKGRGYPKTEKFFIESSPLTIYCHLTTGMKTLKQIEQELSEWYDL